MVQSNQTSRQAEEIKILKQRIRELNYDHQISYDALQSKMMRVSDQLTKEQSINQKMKEQLEKLKSKKARRKIGSKVSMDFKHQRMEAESPEITPVNLHYEQPDKEIITPKQSQEGDLQTQLENLQKENKRLKTEAKLIKIKVDEIQCLILDDD